LRSLTKKEGLMLERERDKLEQTLGGIANMTRLPGAIFVVDTIKEHISINEAVKLNIPIVSIVDTNSDPDIPDHIIPANDDSARTIQLITSQIADAIIEGNAEREAMKEEELMEEAAAEAKKETKEESAEKPTSADEVKTKRRKRRRKASDSDTPETSDKKEEKAEKTEQKEEKAEQKEEESDSDKE
jgi:small subunit ribosomal protein S2